MRWRWAQRGEKREQRVVQIKCTEQDRQEWEGGREGVVNKSFRLTHAPKLTTITVKDRGTNCNYHSLCTFMSNIWTVDPHTAEGKKGEL